MNTERFTINRHAADFLSLKRWVFRYDHDHHALYLHAYYEMSRKTKRHNFRANEQYTDMGDRRQNTLKVEDVRLPPGVIDEARVKFAAYMERVTIEKRVR